MQTQSAAIFVSGAIGIKRVDGIHRRYFPRLRQF